MSDKRKILIQLDTDAQPSVFDRVVAVDAGAEVLFSYGNVKPEQVQALIHGAIFTRHAKDLKHTAVFIGGSDVAAGEKLLAEAKKHLLPAWKLQVSLMLDSNGANTTAAAAVRSAAKSIALKAAKAVVLGGTGPVGQRCAFLLAKEGAEVRLGSRQRDKAAQAVETLRQRLPQATLEPVGTGDPAQLSQALAGRELVIAAGAAGVVLLPRSARTTGLKVLVDLNAVPPAGIEGVDAMDKGKERDGVVSYGAIGVGDLKMKTHKRAIARLFEGSDLTLDVEEIDAIAAGLA
jgi:hypothetical protein